MVLGQVTLAVEHNFETAHRLPFLGGKCQNVHGHSWLVKVHLQNLIIAGGVDENGISMEYASIKKVVRQWIDTYLDHGMMIGRDDSLLDDLWNDGCKVFIFGTNIENEDGIDNYEDVYKQGAGYKGKPWPTVEAVAEMICMKLQEQFGSSIFVVAVELRETATNWVTFTQAPLMRGNDNG